jgi:hypothetical protein
MMFLILRTASSTSPLRTDGLPRRSLSLPFRNDKVCCHREPLAGVAIHCEPESEPYSPYASPETRWIVASLARLPPRNDKMRNFKDDLLPGGIR